MATQKVMSATQLGYGLPDLPAMCISLCRRPRAIRNTRRELSLDSALAVTTYTVDGVAVSAGSSITVLCRQCGPPFVSPPRGQA
jgi:hypothetical protein